MKISQKKKEELYKAIREPIVDIRIALKLSANDDFILAQIENEIWKQLKYILKINE